MQAQPVLPMGTVIQGHYVVVRLLGTGKPGAIYLVRDQQKNQQRVVLKELLHPGWKDEHLLAHEALKFERLEHPALPHVYALFYDETHDRAYMLMEYIEGYDLEQLRLRQPGQLFPLAQVMTLMAPIVDALIYLHNQQPPLVHQYIAPSNIIVARAGRRPILVYFSTAQDTAFALGTPGFGAPEQYNEGASPHTDIYALGATFYTLLTGDVPVDAFGRLAPTESNQADPLVPVNQLVPSIPPAVAQAIQRAMAVQSGDRFPTVAQFWHALREAATQPTPVSESLLATEKPPTADANRQTPQDDTLPRVETVPQTQQPDVLPVTDTLDPRLHPSTSPVVPAASIHDVKTVVPVPVRRQRRRQRWLLLLATAILLLAIVGVGASFWLITAGQQSATLAMLRHKVATQSTQLAASAVPNVTVTSTPVSTVYPNLTRVYAGTVHDIPGDITTKMSLTAIQQQQDSFIGFFAGLNENGSFKGTITMAKHIQFVVTSSTGQTVLSFGGSMLSDGSIEGTYCKPAPAGRCSDYGLWSVVPSS